MAKFLWTACVAALLFGCSSIGEDQVDTDVGAIQRAPGDNNTTKLSEAQRRTYLDQIEKAYPTAETSDFIDVRQSEKPEDIKSLLRHQFDWHPTKVFRWETTTGTFFLLQVHQSALREFKRYSLFFSDVDGRRIGSCVLDENGPLRNCGTDTKWGLD